MKRHQKFRVVCYAETVPTSMPFYRIYVLQGTYRTFTVYTGGA